jgi:OFA family oxalate/formate antiporter-like MFS transporter
MNADQKKLNIRWLYLAVGVVALLFAGIIYGWSILKAPLASELHWADNQLALNFTLTMCFFCLGGIAGGVLSKRAGTRISLILAAVLSCLGFFLTARLDGGSVAMLYVSYGLLAGLGIGIAYNVIISTVSAWFPDKKGVCSGALMMGFGASALVVGNTISVLMDSIGWRNAFTGLGVVLGAVLLATGFIINLPPAGLELPKAEKKAGGASEDFEPRDYTPGEMLRRFAFWRAFVCIVFLAAVGNTVISFARDLAISVGAEAALATTLVGVLSVCNGLGRIATGAIFDKIGRRKTMLLANVVAIAAAGVTLLSVFTSSVPLCIVGLCVTGFSYGSCPTISSAFVSAFYGTKHFSMNFSIMNFNLMGASLLATVSSMLLTSAGTYVAPFALLLALSAVALVLNFSVKKP